MPNVSGTQTTSWAAKGLQVRGCELENIADGTKGEIFLVTLPKGANSVILMHASAESIMVRITQDNS